MAEETVALAPTCGECGVVVVDVEKHTSWHAGTDGIEVDRRAIVLDFLEGIDPAELSRAALNVDPTKDPVAVMLDVLKAAAANA